MLPYFPENISNTEGSEGCLKKQIDSRVFLQKKKLNNSSLFTKGKATISEERKETMKRSRQTQCGNPNKRKRTSPSHPYSPSKDTSRTQAATGASSPPRTTRRSETVSILMASRAFLTASPAKIFLTSKFSYLLLFFQARL